MVGDAEAGLAFRGDLGSQRTEPRWGADFLGSGTARRSSPSRTPQHQSQQDWHSFWEAFLSLGCHTQVGGDVPQPLPALGPWHKLLVLVVSSKKSFLTIMCRAQEPSASSQIEFLLMF